jgi:hypothetical protein
MNKDSMRKKKLEEMVNALIAGDSNTAAKALTEYLQSKTRSMIVSEEYEDVEARGEEGDDEFDFDSEGESDEPGEDEDFEGDADDVEEIEGEDEPNEFDDEGSEFDDEISGEGEDLEFGDESDEEPIMSEGVKKTKVGKIKYSGKSKAKMKKHSNAAPHLGTATKKVKFGSGKPRKVK